MSQEADGAVSLVPGGSVTDESVLPSSGSGMDPMEGKTTHTLPAVHAVLLCHFSPLSSQSPSHMAPLKRASASISAGQMSLMLLFYARELSIEAATL